MPGWLLTEASSTEALPGVGRVKNLLDLVGGNDGQHRLNMDLPCVLGGALWAQQDSTSHTAVMMAVMMHRAVFLKQSFPQGREKSLAVNLWHFTNIQLCRVEENYQVLAKEAWWNGQKSKLFILLETKQQLRLQQACNLSYRTAPLHFIWNSLAFPWLPYPAEAARQEVCFIQ